MVASILTLALQTRYGHSVLSARASAPRDKVRTQLTQSKRKLAAELYVLYEQSILAAIPKSVVRAEPIKLECDNCDRYFLANSRAQRFCERCRKPKKSKVRSLDGLPESDQKHFMAAARICIELECDARDYIAAQFAMWREASAYHKKLLWPMPVHIGKLTAKVRYLQHKAREDIRLSRVGEVEDQDDKRRWFVEERNLKSIARMQRRDPLDVLTEQPEEFSRDFLKYKGVWVVVADLWEEKQRS